MDSIFWFVPIFLVILLMSDLTNKPTEYWAMLGGIIACAFLIAGPYQNVSNFDFNVWLLIEVISLSYFVMVALKIETLAPIAYTMLFIMSVVGYFWNENPLVYAIPMALAGMSAVAAAVRKPLRSELSLMAIFLVTGTLANYFLWQL